MTGLIGGRWTAGNRLEPSRPNGRGRRSCDRSHRRRDPTVGRRAPEGGEPPHRAAPERRTHKTEMVRDRARGRADRTGERAPRGWCGAAPQTAAMPTATPTRAPGLPRGGWGVPVAESVLAPPGPIPNPVVTQRSAGEYCGGDPTGGEAAAGTPHPRDGGEESRRREARWPVGPDEKTDCL
jgi:hypothetical protein